MNRRELMQGVGIIVRDDIKSRFSSNLITPSTKKEGTTLVRSRRLMWSIRYEALSSKVHVGTNSKYAKIHNEGGVIRPRIAKFLAIPIAKIAQTKRPRDFENTFIQNGIIFQAVKDDKPIALYKLMSSVTIPQREYLKVWPDAERRINEVLGQYGLSMLKENL